jgi:hypothetical protein
MLLRSLKDMQDLFKKSFQDVGVTLAVDGSEDHLLNTKGFDNTELSLALKDIQHDLPQPPEEAYCNLLIPGQDDCCLEYTWQAEGIFNISDISGSMEITTSSIEPPAGGNILDIRVPNWNAYKPTFTVSDFECVTQNYNHNLPKSYDPSPHNSTILKF